MYILFVAPSAAPTLGVTRTTTTSISLIWNRLDCIDRNSEITGYTIFYCQLSEQNCLNTKEVYFTNGYPRTFVMLNDLIPRRNYSFRIRANGNNTLFGVISEPIHEQTDVPRS